MKIYSRNDRWYCETSEEVFTSDSMSEIIQIGLLQIRMNNFANNLYKQCVKNNNQN